VDGVTTVDLREAECQKVDITHLGPYSVICRGVNTVAALCCSYYHMVLEFSSAPVSTGNTLQDLPRLRETKDNTERYTYIT
jgi:hypothetical protein